MTTTEAASRKRLTRSMQKRIQEFNNDKENIGIDSNNNDNDKDKNNKDRRVVKVSVQNDVPCIVDTQKLMMSESQKEEEEEEAPKRLREINNEMADKKRLTAIVKKETTIPQQENQPLVLSASASANAVGDKPLKKKSVKRSAKTDSEVKKKKAKEEEKPEKELTPAEESYTAELLKQLDLKTLRWLHQNQTGTNLVKRREICEREIEDRFCQAVRVCLEAQITEEMVREALNEEVALKALREMVLKEKDGVSERIIKFLRLVTKNFLSGLSVTALNGMLVKVGPATNEQVKNIIDDVQAAKVIDKFVSEVLPALYMLKFWSAKTEESINLIIALLLEFMRGD